MSAHKCSEEGGERRIHRSTRHVLFRHDRAVHRTCTARRRIFHGTNPDIFLPPNGSVQSTPLDLQRYPSYSTLLLMQHLGIPRLLPMMDTEFARSRRRRSFSSCVSIYLVLVATARGGRCEMYMCVRSQRQPNVQLTPVSTSIITTTYILYWGAACHTKTFIHEVCFLLKDSILIKIQYEGTLEVIARRYYLCNDVIRDKKSASVIVEKESAGKQHNTCISSSCTYILLSTTHTQERIAHAITTLQPR